MVATLLPVLFLNLQLLRRTLGAREVEAEASAWQEATRGTVNLAIDNDAFRTFKTLRLHDRLAHVDTLVLGSSTMMGLTERALPAPVRAYNLATNSNHIATVIGEAEFVQSHYPQIKRLIIPIDWSVGFVYAADPVPTMDLTLETALKAVAKPAPVPLALRAREALSYPRIVALWSMLRLISQSADPKAAFLKAFFNRVGTESRCGDGTPAKNFAVEYSGPCRGFRFDGSATFASIGRLSAAAEMMRLALSPDERYVRDLDLTDGQPNTGYLERLVVIDRRARENGGELILVRPPLLPGFERALSRLPGPAAALARTDSELDSWARKNRLALINAGRSEDFGCVVGAFVDAHHAVDTCFEKIFADGWPARLAPARD
jgi:hypothetical protein